MPNLEDKMKLEWITDRSFEKLDVKKDCKLREAIDCYNKKFKRGRAYYEFVHDKENISEDKELIFMNKVDWCNKSPLMFCQYAIAFALIIMTVGYR